MMGRLHINSKRGRLDHVTERSNLRKVLAFAAPGKPLQVYACVHFLLVEFRIPTVRRKMYECCTPSLPSRGGKARYTTRTQGVYYTSEYETPLGESVRKRTLVAASRGPQTRAPPEGWTFPLHGPTFLFRKYRVTVAGKGRGLAGRSLGGARGRGGRGGSRSSPPLPALLVPPLPPCPSPSL